MSAVGRMILLIFLLGLVCTGAASAGTTFNILAPSAEHVRHYLERQNAAMTSTNHPFAGFTDPAAANGDDAAPPPPPQGFQERTVSIGDMLYVLNAGQCGELAARVRLGSGRRTYARGSEALLQWRMHEGSSWARIVLGQRPTRPDVQRNMVTVAKALAGLVWCINPCQVLYERRDIGLKFLSPPGAAPEQPPVFRENPSQRAERRHDKKEAEDGGRLWAGRAPASAPRYALFLTGSKHKGKQSAVAYATKEGHLMQGEERMRVLWFAGHGGDDSVWFEAYSVSRGAGFVGGLVFPFVQSMQKRFFREQAETMRRIVSPPC